MAVHYAVPVPRNRAVTPLLRHHAVSPLRPLPCRYRAKSAPAVTTRRYSAPTLASVIAPPVIASPVSDIATITTELRGEKPALPFTRDADKPPSPRADKELRVAFAEGTSGESRGDNDLLLPGRLQHAEAAVGSTVGELGRRAIAAEERAEALARRVAELEALVASGNFCNVCNVCTVYVQRLRSVCGACAERVQRVQRWNVCNVCNGEW